MSLLRAGYEILREEGVGSFLKRGSAYAYREGLAEYHKRTGKSTEGTPVFEEDWDCLIVLDACRLDTMQQVSPEYEWIENVEEFNSLGSATHEWLRNNFRDRFEDEKSETVMVTSNPYAQQVLNEEEWLHMEKVWEYVDWKEDGTILPSDVTDVAIRLRRKYPDARFILHYMQPHIPFVNSELSNGLEFDNWGEVDTQRTVWEKVRDGGVDEDAVLEAYRDNLRLVLDDLERLLDNFEAEDTVITSDHGNALGEVPLIYGHPPKVSIEPLRTVPWIRVTSVDNHTYEPEEINKESVGDDTEELLKNLGYKE